MLAHQQAKQQKKQPTQRYNTQLLALNQMKYRQSAARVQQATQGTGEIQEKQPDMPIHQQEKHQQMQHTHQYNAQLMTLIQLKYLKTAALVQQAMQPTMDSQKEQVAV